MKNAESILNKVFEKHPKHFNILLWNGHRIEWAGKPKFTLVFRDKSFFKRFVLRGDAYTVGKGFIEKRFDIDGDLYEAVKLADHLSGLRFSLAEKLSIAYRVLTL